MIDSQEPNYFQLMEYCCYSDSSIKLIQPDQPFQHPGTANAVAIGDTNFVNFGL